MAEEAWVGVGELEGVDTNGFVMDTAAKAKRSQALIDSIEELIALERDVSLATDSCQRTNGQPPQQVSPTEAGGHTLAIPPLGHIFQATGRTEYLSFRLCFPKSTLRHGLLRIDYVTVHTRPPITAADMYEVRDDAFQMHIACKKAPPAAV